MYQLKIVSRPSGDDPDWVRDAWVGLVLPTVLAQPKSFRSIPVSENSADTFNQIKAIFAGKSFRMLGFPVHGKSAIDILGEANPEAAKWWRENHPSIASGKGFLIFQAEECEIIGREKSSNPVVPLHFKRLFPASAGRVAALWIAVTAINIADYVFVGSEEHPDVIGLLHLGGMPVLAALLVAAVMRVQRAFLHLASLNLSIYAVVTLSAFLAKMAFPICGCGISAFALTGFVAGSVYLTGQMFWDVLTPVRRLAVHSILIASALISYSAPDFSYMFWELAEEVRPIFSSFRAASEDRIGASPRLAIHPIPR